MLLSNGLNSSLLGLSFSVPHHQNGLTSGTTSGNVTLKPFPYVKKLKILGFVILFLLLNAKACC